MKKFFLIFLISFLILPIITLAQGEKKKAVYFYSDTCPRCLNVDRYFSETGIDERYDIQKWNTHQNENFEKLNGLFSAFGVDEANRGVPVIFFGRIFLAGDVPIIREFVTEIENSQASFFPEAEIIDKLNQAEKDAINQRKDFISNIPVAIVASAALLDIFNPCSLAVLFSLVTLLFAARFKKRMFLFGLIFSFAIFISHASLAFVIYNSLENNQWQGYMFVAVTTFAFLIALVNLRKIFWWKKSNISENKIVYRLRVWWHETRKLIEEKIFTTAGFFGLGIILSSFLWVCSNEPYRAVIGSLKEENNLLKTLEILLMYNLIFIIPYILISWLIENFSQTKKFVLFHEKILKLIKIFLGVIMVFVGLYLLIAWFK